MKTSVKVHNESTENFKRFNVESFKELTEKISSLFGLDDSMDVIEMKYQDKDGDWISFHTEEEFIEGLKFIDEKNSTMKINLKRKHEKSESSSSSSSEECEGKLSRKRRKKEKSEKKKLTREERQKLKEERKVKREERRKERKERKSEGKKKWSRKKRDSSADEHETLELTTTIPNGSKIFVFDANNMMYLTESFRKLKPFRKEGMKEVGKLLIKLFEAFHKEFNLEKTFVVFDLVDEKEVRKTESFEVICARPEFKTADDLMVKMSEDLNKDGIDFSKYCFVTSDVEFQKRLISNGVKNIMKSGRWLKAYRGEKEENQFVEEKTK